MCLGIIMRICFAIIHSLMHMILDLVMLMRMPVMLIMLMIMIMRTITIVIMIMRAIAYLEYGLL